MLWQPVPLHHLVCHFSPLTSSYGQADLGVSHLPPLAHQVQSDKKRFSLNFTETICKSFASMINYLNY